MTTIDARALVPSGVEISQAVFMEEDQPVDLSFFDRRYLQSGNIEPDTSLFDINIFTAFTALNFSIEDVGFGANLFNGVAFGGGVYVAVGQGGQIATSPDRAVWTQRVNPFTSDVFDVVYDGSQFVAVGFDGELATSPTGAVWTARVSSFGTTSINSIAFGGGVYVAVGSSGKIASSVDGENWTQETNTFASTISVVAHGGGNFVAAGFSGALEISPDGENWTAHTSSFGASGITGVAFGNGLYVAVGATGKVATSTDAETWTQGTSGIVGFFVDATFVNGLFIILAQSDFITSMNGFDWFINTEPSTESMRCIITNGDDEGITGGGNSEAMLFDISRFAGTRTAHAENGENQYIRII